MKTLEERFWAKVQKGSDCWLWVAAKSRAGYGLIGRGPGSRALLYAHRLSFELATGTALQPGSIILHICDNPACVNPKHLVAGTQYDNMQDAKAKGRMKKKSKLEPKMIQAVYNKGEKTMQQIAEEYGVCIATVHKYVHTGGNNVSRP